MLNTLAPSPETRSSRGVGKWETLAFSKAAQPSSFPRPLYYALTKQTVAPLP